MQHNIEEKIKEIIAKEQYISVSKFMELALAEKNAGYYQLQKPFGIDGDFVTAPEISQLFGEMIGIWLAYHFQQFAISNQFSLTELGPGRGFMMQDIIRATNNVENFHNLMHINMVEISDQLTAIQQNNINFDRIKWYKSFGEIEKKDFNFIIGNEFFDALPIDIYKNEKDKWLEQVVIYKDNQFYFDFIECNNIPDNNIFNNCYDGNYVEYSPAIINIFNDICKVIYANNGIGLFIDYGYVENNNQRTLQALKKHKFHNILDEIGSADLTAHVNFKLLEQIALDNKLKVKITTQQEFLTNIGIVARNHVLKQNVATSEEMIKLDKALERLISPEQMGTLFKVIVIYPQEFDIYL